VGLTVGKWTEEIRYESVNDGGLAGPSITADDDEPTAVVNDIVECPSKLSALLSPPHDVLSTIGRSGRFHHEHYRATSR